MSEARRSLVTDEEALQEKQVYEEHSQRVTLELRAVYCRLQIILVIITLTMTYLSLFLTCYYSND